MAERKPWMCDEFLLAMNLYCKLPFGQLRHGNAEVIRLAEALGRTPSSVSMKLCNFASFDPALQARGVRGLRGASRADRDVWDEFHGDWEKLAQEFANRTRMWFGKTFKGKQECPPHWLR